MYVRARAAATVDGVGCSCAIGHPEKEFFELFGLLHGEEPESVEISNERKRLDIEFVSFVRPACLTTSILTQATLQAAARETDGSTEISMF